MIQGQLRRYFLAVFTYENFEEEYNECTRHFVNIPWYKG
jgi:uncharacterized protein (DUF2225 family)